MTIAAWVSWKLHYPVFILSNLKMWCCTNSAPQLHVRKQFEAHTLCVFPLLGSPPWRGGGACVYPKNLTAVQSRAILLVGSPMENGSLPQSQAELWGASRQSKRWKKAAAWRGNLCSFHAIRPWPSPCQGPWDGCLWTNLPMLRDPMHTCSSTTSSGREKQVMNPDTIEWVLSLEIDSSTSSLNPQ